MLVLANMLQQFDRSEEGIGINYTTHLHNMHMKQKQNPSDFIRLVNKHLLQ